MSKKKHLLRIGISVGDPNGIGLEIIVKTLQKKGILDFFTPVIFGSTKLFSHTKNLLNSDLPLRSVPTAKEAIAHKVNIVTVGDENFSIEPGKATKEAGRYAFKSLEAATEALLKDHVDVLVTAPINKELIQTEGFDFPGHTEYLASSFKEDSLMFMIHEKIRVGLVTNHLAVHEISGHINQKAIQRKARLMSKTLTQDFALTNPKIAILGLNPHCGDNGLIGNEEIDHIIPAIKQLKEEGILAFGPFASDGFFGSDAYLHYDAVLAMYHDQGLIPFKQITFGEGVNFTAGLSKIRTSPDHGVAYDLAGKNNASETSFQEAIFSAITLYHSRSEYLSLYENQLQKQSINPISDRPSGLDKENLKMLRDIEDKD